MLTILKVVALAVVVAAPLAPLPNVPVIPDGTDVKIVALSEPAVYATGTVKNRVLVMTTVTGKLPANEKVNLWIGIPVPGGTDTRDAKSFAATTSGLGTDLYIGTGKDRVSFTLLLKEVYGIRLETH